MASQYSPKLRFELIGAGEQPGLWGTTTNKNIGQLIEQAIAGVTIIELDGLSGNYTVQALDGAPDQARSAVLACVQAVVPAAGPINLIIPAQTKLYVVRNDCGQQITVKTSGQTGGVLLENGEATLVFCDGTDAVLGLETAAAGTLGVSGGGTGQSSFTAGFVKSPGGASALTTTAAVNMATEVTGVLTVPNGGTGQSTFLSGRLLVGNGAGGITTLAGNTNGQIATWSETLQTWYATAAPSGGVTSVTASGAGITASPTTGSVIISNTGVTSFNGRTGPVSPQSGDYSSFYYSTSNPSGYITSSALSGYATLSGTNSWSGANTFTGSLTSQYHNFSSQTAIYGAIPGGGEYFQVNIDVISARVIDFDNSEVVIYEQTYPFADNSYSFGRNGNRWTAIWAANGTIQTSDQRLKKDITASQLGLSFINRLRPVSYKWIIGENELDGYTEEQITDKDGNVVRTSKIPTYKPRAGTRTHYGFISQEVKAALDQEAVGDFGGWVLADKDDPNSEQCLRYDQFISPLVKAVQELSAKVQTLEAEVAALKGN